MATSTRPRLTFSGDLDCFLCGTNITSDALPKSLVDQWLSLKPHERPSTVQRRIILVRQLGRLMARSGPCCLHSRPRYRTPSILRILAKDTDAKR